MLTSDFDYVLPPERIAQTPAPLRGGSRLMVLDRAAGSIQDRRFSDFPSFLRRGDLLILNDTKVLRARLEATSAKKPGRKVEILLLEKLGDRSWSCLAGPGRNAQPGEVLEFGNGRARAKVVSTTDFGGRVLEFEADAEQLMRDAGKMPLPPYIRKATRDDKVDEERYQTVFASEPGAVAAPTAALHFTPEMLEAIKGMGVQIERITLHVGLGTFRPVKTERAEDHVMHEEKFRISSATAEAVRDARAANRRVVAVGTTAVRVLESFFGEERPEPDRWQATRLFILPGHKFRAVDAMLTNFHLPRSTLLMLACAFAGCKPRRSLDDGGGDNNIEAGREFLLRAYLEAIRLEYRFYSYGDAMFIQ